MLQGQCDKFVHNFSPKLVGSIVDGIQLDKVCKHVGVCFSSIEEEIADQEDLGTHVEIGLYSNLPINKLPFTLRGALQKVLVVYIHFSRSIMTICITLYIVITTKTVLGIDIPVCKLE